MVLQKQDDEETDKEIDDMTSDEEVTDDEEGEFNDEFDDGLEMLPQQIPTKMEE